MNDRHINKRTNGKMITLQEITGKQRANAAILLIFNNEKITLLTLHHVAAKYTDKCPTSQAVITVKIITGKMTDEQSQQL